jgi:hypothetical protein
LQGKTIIEICNDSIKPVVNIATQKLLIEGKNILKIAFKFNS